MKSKERFTTGTKILYAVLVIFILLMFWPASRLFMQRSLMKIGLFKPKIEQTGAKRESTGRLAGESENTTPNQESNVSFIGNDSHFLQIKDLKGKVIFINFWATWCGPCVAEMPSIQKLYDKFKNNPNVVFALVEIEGDLEVANSFMKEHNLNMPIYVPNSDIPIEWLDGAIPSTVVLDKQGAVGMQHRGMANYDTPEFESFIEGLAAK